MTVTWRLCWRTTPFLCPHIIIYDQAMIFTFAHDNRSNSTNNSMPNAQKEIMAQDYPIFSS